MKSANTWVAEMGNRLERQNVTTNPSLLRHIIHQIQLEAYKEGMTDAADIVLKQADKFDSPIPTAFCAQAIIEARDAKKTL